MEDKSKSLNESALSVNGYELTNAKREREGLSKISMGDWLNALKGAHDNSLESTKKFTYNQITIEVCSEVKSDLLVLWNKLLDNETILTCKAGIVDVIVGELIPTVDDLVTKQTVIGCFYQGSLIGFISGKHDENPKGKSFEVSMLYVEKYYRHKGIGKRLWGELMGVIGPVDTLVTNVMYNNPEAIAFYKSLGMREFIIMMSS